MQAMRPHEGNDQVSAETTDGENIREEGSDQDMENQEDSLSSDENGKSQDPWNPSLWSGDITELHQQLEGLTIPHDLKKEIYHILHEAPEGRYAELLAFLVNTASQLSRNERDRLLDSQLDDPSDPAVIELLQKYNIPMVVLEQWKAMAALERQDSQQGEVDQHENNNMASEDEFIPSSAQSVDEQGTTRELTIRTRSMSSNQKRQHSTTPTEAEQIRQSVRSRLENEQHSNMSEEMIVDTNPPIRGFSRPDWPHMWVSLATEWPTDSSRHFPRPGTSQEEWEATAIQEPERLMELLQKFPFPQEIMMILSGKVLVAWTAKWRRECLFTGLQGYKERTTDSGVKAWLTEWLSRFPQSISTTLAPLVDMRDDWTKLKGYSYGKDVVLKLCDVAHRGRLAQHLLCAILYSQEIRVLLDHNEENEDGIAGNLRRHLQALHKDKRYSEVYYASKQQLDWIGIAQFFASVFEQGEQSVEYQQTRQ
ncbi:hypothetical protein DVH05_000165 [Phytophthora capsici]|nr:hypothetical protein DVH05_000165 [Phytophthora capsici]